MTAGAQTQKKPAGREKQVSLGGCWQTKRDHFSTRGARETIKATNKEGGGARESASEKKEGRPKEKLSGPKNPVRGKKKTCWGGEVCLRRGHSRGSAGQKGTLWVFFVKDRGEREKKFPSRRTRSKKRTNPCRSSAHGGGHWKRGTNDFETWREIGLGIRSGRERKKKKLGKHLRTHW